MSLSLYFYISKDNRNDIENYLTDIIKSLSKEENSRTYYKEDDGDVTFYIKCKYFLADSCNEFISSVGKEQGMEFNYALSIDNIIDYSMVLQLISEILQDNKGDLILFDDSENILIERNHNQVFCNYSKYYFQGHYEDLECDYITGDYKWELLNLKSQRRLIEVGKCIYSLYEKLMGNEVVNYTEYLEEDMIIVSSRYYRIHINNCSIKGKKNNYEIILFTSLPANPIDNRKEQINNMTNLLIHQYRINKFVANKPIENFIAPDIIERLKDSGIEIVLH